MFDKHRNSLVLALVIAILANAIFATPVRAQTQQVDDMKFISDVTIPDGTQFQPGQSFVKTWRIKNVGTSTWSTAYVFAFVDGTNMNPAPSSQSMVAGVAKDNTVDLSVAMTAPSTPGSYKSFFQMRNAQGVGFGPRIWVSITVPGASPIINGGSVAATASPNLYDFRTINNNTVEVYMQKGWTQATKSPTDHYVFAGLGSFNTVTYSDCSLNPCQTKTKLVAEIGLQPAISLSVEGVNEFFGYLEGFNPASYMTIVNGTFQGINGWTVSEYGKIAGLTANSLRNVTGAVTGAILIPGFIHNAEKIWIIHRPMNAVAAPTPYPWNWDLSSYSKIAGLAVSVIGTSRGRYDAGNGWYAWDFTSLGGYCSLWMQIHLPSFFGGGFFDLTEELKKQETCRPEDFILFAFKVAKLALDGGVLAELLQLMLEFVLPKVFADFKIDPQCLNDILAILRSVSR